MSIGGSQRWWSAVALGYDPTVALVGWHRWQDALVADVDTGSVLDIGCGPAHPAHGLTARGVRYVGVDRNAGMLARARHGWERRHAGPVRLVRADASALPFADDSFDLVMSCGFLGLLAVRSRALVLAEVARVCRGHVRLLEPVTRADAPLPPGRARAVALVTERPLELSELAGAGLRPESLAPPVLLGVYSPVRASPG